MTEVEYRSGELALSGWLSELPADGSSRPAVVYLHGGWSFSEVDWTDATPFIDAGYVLFMPRLRGENGNPGHYSGFWGEVDDAVAAGDHVAALPGVDRDRVFVVGHSVGGILATLTAMVPSPYRGAVSLSGVSDMRLFIASFGPAIAPFDFVDETEFRLRDPMAFPGSLRMGVLVAMVGESSILERRAARRRRHYLYGPEVHLTSAPTMLGPARVQHIALEKIELDDETFRFRAALRIGPLKDSIAAEGQQLPIVVRRVPDTRPIRYQIISGFRRATAMTELGAPTIAAIVRDDLASDEAAFRASVLENSLRKTYSDIDRALVIQRYESRGFRSVDVADLMGLSRRQKNNLRTLLDLPQSVQEAIDDPDDAFTATHGLVLRQLEKRYPGLDYPRWVAAVRAGNDGAGLSVRQLKRAVNEHHRPAPGAEPMGSIFRDGDTRVDCGVFRLQPVKIEVAALTDDERAALRSELETLLAALAP